jgi:hypothetical protein
LAPLATAFVNVILAVHIMATVIAFGVVFAYPLFFFVGARMDKRAMAWFHRMEYLIGVALITPGLVVVAASGVYLASKEHIWKAFFVQWGVGIAVVIAVAGAVFFSPQEAKLAKLAARDIEAAGDGEVTFSDEYVRLSRIVAAAGITTFVLVLVTIYLMTIQP